jgi:cell division cycle 20-like protein 1 (cofactor of APC complex)
MKRKQDAITMSPAPAIQVLSSDNRTSGANNTNALSIATNHKNQRLGGARARIDSGTPQRRRANSTQCKSSPITNDYGTPKFKSYGNDCSIEVPPSPCATSIATSSPDTPSGSIGSSSEKFSYHYPQNGQPKILPPQSPRRQTPPLDPQYASRLFEALEREKEKHDSFLMPPPTLHRGSIKNIDMSASDYRTPVNSIGGASIETPFCTPEGKSARARSDSSSGSAEGKSISFYTPRRSVRGIVGHQISFSSRSPSSLSSGSPSSLSGNKDTTPTSTDRFIPSRAMSNLSFSVWGDDDKNETQPKNDDSDTMAQTNFPSEEDGTPRQDNVANQNQNSQPPLLNMLLRSELLGENIDPAQSNSPNVQFVGQPARTNHRNPLAEGGNFLRYNNQRQNFHDTVQSFSDPNAIVDSFSLSPVRMSSNYRLMSMPQKRKRKIAKVPFKVLDAPALADDFYLNLVDWSAKNVLAVGLGSCVYLWSACTSKVTKLCDLSEGGDLGTNQESAAVTSVAWTQRGAHLAVGVNNGEVQLFDTEKNEKVRTMEGHSARIGALSWSGPILASGSRDRLIYLHDMRAPSHVTARLASHKQEVCGLKWSFDEPAHLASGGNDNKLLVWDIRNHRQEAHRFAEHTAAVKAIAWSPHQHGLLASGGGTADRCIRFWNALSGSPLNAIDTGSQVCNLAWSQNCNELVSTHGYSLNQIALWKYPTMQKVATLTGHTYRVLYLAMSPDGSTIVTGAGDETLRFWQVFPGPRSNNKNGKNGMLFPQSPFSVLR